jgi:hypothetical protein
MDYLRFTIYNQNQRNIKMFFMKFPIYNILSGLRENIGEKKCYFMGVFSV